MRGLSLLLAGLDGMAVPLCLPGARRAAGLDVGWLEEVVASSRMDAVAVVTAGAALLERAGTAPASEDFKADTEGSALDEEEEEEEEKEEEEEEADGAPGWTVVVVVRSVLLAVAVSPAATTAGLVRTPLPLP